MLNATLKDGLDGYRIGAKIRDLRTRKGLGLAQLGDHTGLSAGMLSKIERGSVFPTLPTLLRIALVFGVGLDHFFSDGDEPVLQIVRRKDRIQLPNVTDKKPSFLFESLDFPVNDRALEAYLAEFLPNAPATDPHEHRQDELIYVMDGSLEIAAHGKKHRLDAGDSIYFDAGYPHSYRATGNERTRVIVVVADNES